MGKYKIKEGVVLKPYGIRSEINNDNLTDGIAELLIKKGKAKKEDFITTKTRTKNGNSK